MHSVFYICLFLLSTLHSMKKIYGLALPLAMFEETLHGARTLAKHVTETLVGKADDYNYGDLGLRLSVSLPGIHTCLPSSVHTGCIILKHPCLYRTVLNSQIRY